MKDILFIRASYTNTDGGIEGQIIQIADNVYSRKILNPILATDNKDYVLPRKFKEMGFAVYEIPIKQMSIIKGANDLDIVVKKHNIALIQSHMFRESFIGRILRMRHRDIPHIFRAHTYIDCSWIPEWKKYLYHIFDKITSHYVDKYIVSGKYLFKEAVKRTWISQDKICVLNDGCEQIGIPDPPITDLTGSLPNRVAMLSRFVPFKRHDILIKCLSILRKRGVKVHARLIGKDDSPIVSNTGEHEFTNRLKREALKLNVLDQIEFIGYVDDLYKALKEFPVVVLPSDSEGIPVSLIEAISIRKLVIASNVGGIPGIIKNGKNGFLHPPRDPNALADILENIFSSPSKNWETIRNEGLKTWKNEFSTEQMIERLINIYSSIGVIR